MGSLMKLYIMLDCERLEEKQEKQLRKSADEIAGLIKGFVEASPQPSLTSVLKYLYESDVLDWQLGVELTVSKSAQLKAILDFFNQLAKQFKQDFVLGIIDGESREDICYFGFEEGQADRLMISQYLGI